MRWNNPGREGPATRSCRCYWPRMPTGLGDRAGILPGFDFRGRGGYVVGPPSVHPGGHRYRWINRLLEELAPAPGWLIQLLVPERRPERPKTVPEGSRAYGLGAERCAESSHVFPRQAKAPATANSIQPRSNMGRLVAAGALCEQKAAAALIEQGQRIGLGPTECERTVASGLSAGTELTFAGNIIETGTVSYRLAHARAQRASR
jgi:hypothetical protein